MSNQLLPAMRRRWGNGGEVAYRGENRKITFITLNYPIHSIL
jgi:hypothetical protein